MGKTNNIIVDGVTFTVGVQTAQASPQDIDEWGGYCGLTSYVATPEEDDALVFGRSIGPTLVTFYSDGTIMASCHASGWNTMAVRQVKVDSKGMIDHGNCYGCGRTTLCAELDTEGFCVAC